MSTRPEESVQREATQAQEGKETHTAPTEEQAYQKLHKYVVDTYGDMSLHDFDKRFDIRTYDYLSQFDAREPGKPLLTVEFDDGRGPDDPNGVVLYERKKPYTDNELREMWSEEWGVPGDGDVDEFLTSIRNKKISDMTGETETARPETERDSHAQTKIDYENAVDPDLIDFKETVRTAPGNMVNSLEFRISKVSDRQRADLERLTGEPVNANSNFIKGDRIVHIEDRHGKSGSADQSMADPKDVARMAYVLENYDTVDFLRDAEGNIITDGQYTGKDGMPAKVVAYVKRVNGFYIVVEAVNDGKRGRLNIISAYKNKKNLLENQKTRMHDDTSVPKPTPEAVSALTSDTNIPPSDTKSKEKNKNFSEPPEQGRLKAAQDAVDAAQKEYDSAEKAFNQAHYDGKMAWKLEQDGTVFTAEESKAIQEVHEKARKSTQVKDAAFKKLQAAKRELRRLTEAEPTTEPSTKPANDSATEGAPPTVEEIEAEIQRAIEEEEADLDEDGEDEDEDKPIMMPVALNDVKLNPKVSKTGQRQYTVTQIDGKGKAAVRQFVYDPNKTGHLYEVVDGKPKDGKPIFENPNETDVRHIIQAYVNGETLTKFKHFEDSEWASTSWRDKDRALRVGRGDGGEASADRFAEGEGGTREPFAPDSFSDDAEADSDLRPVEMPELVKMVEDLIGKRPAVMRKDKIKDGAYGYAVRVKDKVTGEAKWVNVQLAAELPKDPRQAAKAIAHEIGHIMTKYGGQGKYKALATKLMNAAHTFDGRGAKESGMGIIYDELYALSKKWRPFQEGKDAKHDRYRKKGEEVFADAVSVYLTDPAMLKREAPVFWHVFHGWEGARNPFTEVYKAVQELYGRGEEAVGAEREARTIAGYKRGGEINKEARALRDKEERESTALGRVMESIRDYLWERNGPLLKLVENVKKGGAKIADAVNPYLTKRAMPYLKSQQSAYVLDVRNALQEIIGPLDEETRIDIGLYLQNARIALGDRGELWNPGGETSETSKAALKQLERRVGKERFELIKAAAEKFIEIRYDHIIPEIIKSGAFSKEYVEKVLNNKHYATFEVLQELGKELGEDAVKGITGLSDLSEPFKPVGAHKQVGTTKAIHNPFEATLRNDIQMLAFIDRNTFARNTIDLLLNHKNTLGFEAKEQEQKRVLGRPAGYEKHDNTIFVLRDGKTTAYRVSRELVPMFKHAGKPGAAAKLWDKLVSNPVRNILTQKNPAFWIWNVQRDFRTFHRNIKGTAYTKAKYMWKAFLEIKGYTWHGEMTADVRAALRERAMLPTSVYTKDNVFFEEDKAFDRDLASFDTEQGQANFCLRRLHAIGQFLDNINNTLELTTKLAGYKLLRDQGEMSAEQRAHTVRTRVGTPDFLAGGTGTPLINRILLFSNVNIQGLRESLNAMRENPGRAIGMTLAYSAIPALWSVLAERGLLSKALSKLFGDGGDDLGKWFEEAYARIPRFERVYRWAIPIGTVKGKTKADDQTIFIPLPTSEVGSVQQGIWYHVFSMMFEKSGEAVVDDLLDVFGEIYKAFPGNIHPALKGGAAVMQYATHQNPVDPHYGTRVIPQKEYRVSTANDLKHLGKYAWNSMGGATLWRLDRKALDFKDKRWLEKALGLPVVGNPLGRFVRVSNRGLEEEKREKKADAALERKRRAAEKSKSQK